MCRTLVSAPSILSRIGLFRNEPLATTINTVLYNKGCRKQQTLKYVHSEFSSGMTPTSKVVTTEPLSVSFHFHLENL